MDAWTLIIIGVGLMQAAQAGLLGFLVVRYFRLWAIVKGPNGDKSRMATHHDVNNVKQVQTFFDGRLAEIEKALKLTVPGHMRPVPRDE